MKAERGWPRLSVVALVGLGVTSAVVLVANAVTATLALNRAEVGASIHLLYALVLVPGAITGFSAVI